MTSKLQDARTIVGRIPTTEVLIGLSGGKDSLAVLDLCAHSGRFSRLACYYLYLVDGIECIESHVRLVAKRYDAELHKVPHPDLVTMLKHGAYGPQVRRAEEGREWRHTDAENAARARAGIEWVATGHKACDSLDRRAMLSTFPDGVNTKAHRAYPVRAWSQADVWAYVNQKKIPTPVRFPLGKSGRMSGFNLKPDTLVFLREHYPEDYRRVVDVFPFVEAAIFRHEKLGVAS